jgi:hypothetical protein
MWDLFFFFLRSSGKRNFFVGLDYQGKDIVFKFIIEYNNLRDFGPKVIIGLFLYDDF